MNWYDRQKVVMTRWEELRRMVRVPFRVEYPDGTKSIAIAKDNIRLTRNGVILVQVDLDVNDDNGKYLGSWTAIEKEVEINLKETKLLNDWS